MYRNNLFPPIFPAAWACDFGEDRYGLWMAFSYQEVRMALRWIQPGTFMMGSPENEEGHYHDEVMHQVTLTQGFWMGETSVTQALWQKVMDNNPSHFNENESNPVEQVSWHDAQEFIQKLNKLLQPHQPDYALRLPTEAEWEYACRAGISTPFNFASELSLEKVNYCGSWDSQKFANSALQKTTSVKSYPCNAWGLYEMHGNVWEWCLDCRGENLSSEPVIDPIQQNDSLAHISRGGAWSNVGRDVRSAVRTNLDGDLRHYDLGFRFALGLQA
jgi:formylglycine-generating enzyme required for sulfatase activity